MRQIPDRYKELLKLVLEKTKEDKLKWQLFGASSNDCFKCFLVKECYITLSHGFSTDSFDFGLYQDGGRKLDSFEFDCIRGDEKDRDLLSSVFENARISGNEIQQILDRVVKKLKSHE